MSNSTHIQLGEASKLKIVYNTFMAKRATGVGSKKQNHPHKTKKRLEAKKLMLAAKRKRK